MPGRVDHHAHALSSRGRARSCQNVHDDQTSSRSKEETARPRARAGPRGEVRRQEHELKGYRAHRDGRRRGHHAGPSAEAARWVWSRARATQHCHRCLTQVALSGAAEGRRRGAAPAVRRSRLQTLRRRWSDAFREGDAALRSGVRAKPARSKNWVIASRLRSTVRSRSPLVQPGSTPISLRSYSPKNISYPVMQLVEREASAFRTGSSGGASLRLAKEREREVQRRSFFPTAFASLRRRRRAR